MREAAIVSTARTPIGKAFRGAFNQTHGATLAGHVIEHAVARAGVAPEEVEDVVRRPDGGACAHRGSASGRTLRRGHHVRRRWPGSRGPVRGRLARVARVVPSTGV